MLNKVKGIKSVDIKITASGFGVVNWNGNFPLQGNSGKEENNHTLPKLRGFTNESGKIKEDTGYRFKKKATEINFKETPLYISQNCIRHHLFKDQSYDFHFASKKDSNKDPKKLLISISGLLRGYVIPNTQSKRKSPLLIEDFIDDLGNGNFEQFANSGEKNENSIFSKTTFGKTQYTSYASISIEDIQFISLDKKFDRASIIINSDDEGEQLAKELTDFINEMSNDNTSEAKAVYGKYTRIGSIYEEQEVGILLNETAIDILVNYMIELIEELNIKQAKGWMSVDDLEIDYNNSNKMMRIIKNISSIEDEKNENYAMYYKLKE